MHKLCVTFVLVSVERIDSRIAYSKEFIAVHDTCDQILQQMYELESNLIKMDDNFMK